MKVLIKNKKLVFKHKNGKNYTLNTKYIKNKANKVFDFMLWVSFLLLVFKIYFQFFFG